MGYLTEVSWRKDSMSSGDDLILRASWNSIWSDLRGKNIFGGLTFVWDSG